MLTAMKIHVARASANGALTHIQALLNTPAKLSILTVKQLTVLITVIINVLLTMLISAAAMHTLQAVLYALRLPSGDKLENRD